MISYTYFVFFAKKVQAFRCLLNRAGIFFVLAKLERVFSKLIKVLF